MICESVNYGQEENEGDVLNGNRGINLVLVCKYFSHERELQIKLEEERDV